MHIISSYAGKDDMHWEEYIEKLQFIMHCPVWVLFKISKYSTSSTSV